MQIFLKFCIKRKEKELGPNYWSFDFSLNIHKVVKVCHRLKQVRFSKMIFKIIIFSMQIQCNLMMKFNNGRNSVYKIQWYIYNLFNTISIINKYKYIIFRNSCDMRHSSLKKILQREKKSEVFMFRRHSLQQPDSIKNFSGRRLWHIKFYRVKKKKKQNN